MNTNKTTETKDSEKNTLHLNTPTDKKPVTETLVMEKTTVETPVSEPVMTAAVADVLANVAARETTKKASAKAKKPVKVETKKAPAKTTVDKKEAKPKKEAMARDKFGFKVGSKQSQAAAMYASKTGANNNRVKEKLGSNHLNLLHDVARRGFKVIKVKKLDKTTKKMITHYFIREDGKVESKLLADQTPKANDKKAPAKAA